MELRTSHTHLAADEAPRREDRLEWWFVQGLYETETSGRRHFLCSLFRERSTRDKSGTDDAFCLLLSVLDPATGETEKLCQVDESMVGSILERSAAFAKGDGDAHVVQAFRRELAAFGPPHPIRLAATEPHLAAERLDARWGSFALRQEDGRFTLSFAEPGSGRLCTFNLEPRRDRLAVDDIHVLGRRTMACSVHPRLALAGTVEGEPARGEAWLDHQYGNHGWLTASAATRRVLGWTWFGINLDDGSDLLIVIHEDRREGTHVGAWAVFCEEGRDARSLEAFDTEPKRWWVSLETNVRYPIAWRIHVPELDLALDFEPLADDQELPLLGLLRAVWQGAGRVRGTRGGTPVAGRGRLELLGHASLLDAETEFDRWARRIDARVEACLPHILDDAALTRLAGEPEWWRDSEAQTAVLAAPLWDLMARAGKHWRPIFGVLMLKALGAPIEPYETMFTVGPELAHTGALVIDDIEDDASERRGDTTIHLRYGTDVAVNAANAAYFIPYLLLHEQEHLTAGQRLELYEIQTRQFLRSHLGQGQDIFWSRHLTAASLGRWLGPDTTDRVLQAYADKTAAIVEGLAASACVIAGVDAATRDACTAFARAFGVAFQIVDDVLDFSDAPHRRRPPGQDLAEGKLTYVILEALRRLPGPDRARLADILGGARDAGHIQEGVALVRASDVLPACREEARRRVEEHWSVLSRHVPPSHAKTLLRALCTRLLDLPATGGETPHDG